MKIQYFTVNEEGLKESFKNLLAASITAFWGNSYEVKMTMEITADTAEWNEGDTNNWQLSVPLTKLSHRQYPLTEQNMGKQMNISPLYFFKT